VEPTVRFRVTRSDVNLLLGQLREKALALMRIYGSGQ
jgi:hypothetical protein